MSRADDSLELRVTTVGTALPNTEIQIVHPKTHRRLPLGQQGELADTRLPGHEGYDCRSQIHGRGDRQEGWLYTGDLAVMRPDGYFSFKGRAKETIFRGGENIYPREVEDFLHTHPKNRRRVRGRVARRQAGRDRAGVDQAQEGRAGHGRGDPRFLPRQDRVLSRSRSSSVSWIRSP